MIFLWRDGRVVDYTGLENRRAARHRGFESLSLRSQKPADFSGLFYFNLTLKSLKSKNFLNTNHTNLTNALVAVGSAESAKYLSTGAAPG